MISFWRIFSLEFTAFVRSKALAMLLLASVVWMWAFPYLVKGDGTAAGQRELTIHYSLGGVFALLVISLLASASGSLARERAARRLQLTLIRPVPYFSVVLAKILALLAVGALVLAVAFALLAVRMDLSVPCSHVLSPVLPSPREEARAMYELYMKDPETPAEVKKAKKEAVIRLLTQRAVDHYETIATNATAAWTFPVTGPVPSPSVRLRLTNNFDVRQEVRGAFGFGGVESVISNITQAVVVHPLTAAGELESADGRLTFRNEGVSDLMLRPRRDLNLLIPADAFGWNLVRAYVELLAILAVLLSFGLLLSAALSRPVALFVAFAMLLMGEMSPSVVAQYPDELNVKPLDRLGLYVTNFATEVTRPVSSLSPLESLAKDECVETAEVLRLAVLDLCLLPLVFSLLAGMVLPRKN